MSVPQKKKEGEIVSSTVLVKTDTFYRLLLLRKSSCVIAAYVEL